MTSTNEPRKPRRAKGDGSVYFDKNRNCYRGCVELPSRTGKRKRRYFTGRTRAEVTRLLREAASRIERGLPIPDQRITMNQLIDLFIEKGFDPKLSPKTVKDNTGVLKFAAARIGGIRVTDLLPSDITGLCGDMIAEGYSSSYSIRVKALLGQVLAFAEAEGLVARNVAKLAKTVAYEARERPRLTKSEAERLITNSEDDRLGAAVAILIFLGLRPGEVTGLPWANLDLDEGVASIQQSLKNHPDPVTGKATLSIGPVKTKRSKRAVRMPAPLIAILRRHRAMQAAEALAAGPHWHNEHNLVFTTAVGTPIDPANLRRTIKRLASEAGIEKAVVPYDGRRTMTDILSDYKVPGERIADVAGNDAATALSIYRQPMDNVIEDAVEPMERFFGTA